MSEITQADRDLFGEQLDEEDRTSVWVRTDPMHLLNKADAAALRAIAKARQQGRENALREIAEAKALKLYGGNWDAPMFDACVENEYRELLALIDMEPS